MKVFLIDNVRKMKRLRSMLEDKLNIESKDNCKFKMTKNDYVIISDEIGFPDELEKLKNIIFLIKDKSYKNIWRLANNYKAVDIIDSNLDEEYISYRICRLIQEEW